MIAVIGAGGQLGTAFVDLLGDRARSVDRSELDLSDLAAIPAWIRQHRPEVLINCAGYTAVDAAESDPDAARLVNATAVGVLAEATREMGVGFVTFSTDYVFDGTKPTPYLESDIPNPLSVYGRTKWEGERLALQANPDTLLIRTSWVISGTHRNFVATMLELMRKGSVSVVEDQRGKPTITDDLAAATLRCVDKGVTGLLHLANQGATTWFGLAREVAELAGLDPEKVKPISTEEFERPAPRPANSVLGSERLEVLEIDPLPHYRDSLPGVVESLISLGY